MLSQSCGEVNSALFNPLKVYLVHSKHLILTVISRPLRLNQNSKKGVSKSGRSEVTMEFIVQARALSHLGQDSRYKPGSAVSLRWKPKRGPLRHLPFCLSPV